MSQLRRFTVSDFLKPSQGEPIRSVVTESADAAVVAWHVEPGQRIAPHVHPTGQDTWIVISGMGEYQHTAEGSSIALKAGEVFVAHRGQVHGVVNTGETPLVFVSVVAPALSGFEPL